MKSKRNRPRSIIGVTSFLLLLIFLVCERTLSLEVKWTPSASSENEPPLPLSMNQRQQLLQLEQTINSSDDPNATVEKIAASNDMSPQDLVNMLSKNRHDLESGAAAADGGGAAGRPPRNVLGELWSLVLTIVGVLGKYARANPRQCGMVASILFLAFYVMVTAPRTGLVLSKQASLLSHGHSTMWKPPAEYLDGYLSSDYFERRRWGEYSFDAEDGAQLVLTKKLQDDIVGMDEDEMTWEKVGRKASKKYGKKMSVFATYRKHISLEPFLDDEDDEENENDQSEVTKLLYNAASTILSSRRLTEFASPALQWRGPSETGLLVVKRMGDWKRYGIQPFQVVHEGDGVLLFGSLTGGHFDGLLRFSIDKDEEGVVVSTSLIVPTKGRKPNKKITETMLTSLTNSITASATTEAKQNLARRSQTHGFKKKFENFTTKKRHILAEKERLNEEMAKTRQRRWMRGHSNANAAGYRPSGDRMKSPNNC